jgi:hypothetical protein
MNHSAVLDNPSARATWRTPAAITVTALLAIGFFAGFALPYLLLDEEVLARYGPRRWWLLVHIAGGTVALLIGPLQLWLGLTRRAMRAHRRLGLAYVTSVGISAPASFYLAAHTTLGWVFGAGLTGLGVAWIVTTTLAVAAVRRRMIEQHREWMVRSYVVTFAFVTFRALFGILQAAGVGTRNEQLAAASWFCWALPLLVTEAVLQGRKIFGTRRAVAVSIALTALMVMPALVHAQSRLTGADLDGFVRDESGGVLPEALTTDRTPQQGATSPCSPGPSTCSTVPTSAR